MENLPVYKLVIDDNDELGVEYIALVDTPAIETNWFAFKDQQFESYDDYPKQASENAKIALRWAEENGWGDCGTPVGKARANQLANGEPISRETIARMAAFERHRQNSQKALGDGCGRLMWLAWGGDAGIEWAQRKLEQIDKQNMVINPRSGESKDEYVSRCIGEEIKNGMDKDQAVAVCYAKSKEHFAGEKISFDYDETLSTERGKELAKRKISEGFTVYIISARQDAEGMYSTADELGIPHSRVYATGSNKAKVEKVKELGIKTHYDNNEDVVNELSGIGHKFKFFANKEKRMISGALMIADLPIYRKDESGEYYVIFDKDQIEKIAQRFFKKGYTHNVNMMHDAERQVNGVYMVESFIIDKTRGIKTPEGYPTLTEGSWFGTFKVDNNEVWNDFIKTGVFKGFSVEGAFAQRKLKDAPVDIIESLADRIHNLRKKVAEIATK